MNHRGSDDDDRAAEMAAELEVFVSDLMMQPDREQVASEIGVLQSIYGDNAIHLWHSSRSGSPGDHTPEHAHHNGSESTSETIRYVVSLNLPSHEDVAIRILVSLPSSYPASSPPQLQLLSRYIGAFGVDASLFGSILRTFISISGVEWSADTVCVFDGLQSVLERCEAWYEDRLNAEKIGDLIREDAHEQAYPDATPAQAAEHLEEIPRPQVPLQDTTLPEGIQIVEAEPIVDRKSVFVGRACRISHPSQVPLILNNLMSDRHIARAAHPIINAWRCQVGNVLHQDNDDDGETAAGSRLAHLLSILVRIQSPTINHSVAHAYDKVSLQEINNVLVVVTRWFGGIHLGPDRFKHINHAARNALEIGGFLDQLDEGGKAGKGAVKGRKR
ncbi:hypothetical protein F5I97DRAFT_1925899 [Phlebopus sp. FC_14]|nr:hypothetical protein F5I97DRAFT_1925899 [Phlebopus sp. FC_14]